MKDIGRDITRFVIIFYDKTQFFNACLLAIESGFSHLTSLN